MTIGIIGAMPKEIALLSKELQNARRETRGMRDYRRGMLYGREITLVFSRWGKVAAASTVTTLIEVFAVDSVIFTGVAGAISSDLEIGDVVIGSEFIQHDLDASGIPGLKRFEVPLLGISAFHAKEDLVDLAKQSGERYLTVDLSNDVPRQVLAEFGIRRPKVRTGLIVSGDQFIASAESVNRLRTILPDAQCVEMEGAAVAQVCYEHEVPLVVVRTISDKADGSAAIDFSRFVDEVAGHFTCGIVRELIARL